MIYFESGLCTAVSYQNIETGECKTVEPECTTWFDSINTDDDVSLFSIYLASSSC